MSWIVIRTLEEEEEEDRGAQVIEVLPKDRDKTDSYKLSVVLTGGCEWCVRVHHRLVLAARMHISKSRDVSHRGQSATTANKQ